MILRVFLIGVSLTCEHGWSQKPFLKCRTWKQIDGIHPISTSTLNIRMQVTHYFDKYTMDWLFGYYYNELWISKLTMLEIV
jgi:hypothetical protein